MKLITFDKKLGLPGAICVTVGAVIGVGIFVVVGPIGADTGVWMPLAFCLAALPAVFGVLVAAALGSTIPADGGGFFYTKSLLGTKTGAAASALIVLGAMGALATVATGVADYMHYYFPVLPRPLVAAGLILLTWGVNAIGIMASEKFQIVLVVQLTSALLIVIVAGVIGGGNPDFSQPLPHGISGFAQGAVLAALSFTGYNILAELGDEIENPRRNIPLTIGLGLGIITVIYVGISWVVAGSMEVAEMKTSRVALLDTALRYLPDWFKHYLNLAALAGAVTSINAVFLAVPREFSALAEEGILPKLVMKFNSRRQTFPVGIMIVALLGCAMIALDLNVDIWGIVCVAGLILAAGLISIGVFRLFSRFPDKVASAPIPIRKYWLYPAAVLSVISSLAFGGLAIVFFWPVGVAAAVLIVGALLLCLRSRPEFAD
jgi:APA family basic amino acid/polyamine antiporter